MPSKYIDLYKKPKQKSYLDIIDITILVSGYAVFMALVLKAI